MLSFKAPMGVFDTSNYAQEEMINLGNSRPILAINEGVDLVFSVGVLVTFSRIDERNLKKCKYLNLTGSSVTNLETMYFVNLIVLILANTGISTL